MVSRTERRLAALEESVLTISTVRDHYDRDSEISRLFSSIGYVGWWDRLDNDQKEEAIKAMKAANTILCERMGFSLRLVKWTEEG